MKGAEAPAGDGKGDNAANGSEVGPARAYEGAPNADPHAGEVEEVLRRGPAPTVLIRRLRLPEEFESTATFALRFLVDAIRRVLGFYFPTEERLWAEWYAREISEGLRRLG
jgi:hypothetical protein